MAEYVKRRRQSEIWDGWGQRWCFDRQKCPRCWDQLEKLRMLRHAANAADGRTLDGRRGRWGKLRKMQFLFSVQYARICMSDEKID